MMNHNHKSKTEDDPTCQRKQRPLDDLFFEAGDKLVFGNSDSQRDGSYAFFYIQESHSKNHNNNTEETNNIDFMEIDQEEGISHHNKATIVSFPCPACSKMFTTISDCQNHYESCHVLSCHVCHAILSSDYLLDLHLQEGHDSYFAARNTTKYKCLVETCTHGGFGNAQERWQHLQLVHGYPKWFRFFPKSRHYGKQHGINNVLEKSKRPMWMKTKQSNKSTTKHTTQDVTMETDKTDLHTLKRLKRRQGQLQKRATIPCKFFATPAGCFRGDSCMFLHDDMQHNASSNGPMETTAMHDLTSDLKHKAKISVPDKISFGHRPRVARRHGGFAL